MQMASWNKKRVSERVQNRKVGTCAFKSCCLAVIGHKHCRGSLSTASTTHMVVQKHCGVLAGKDRLFVWSAD